MATTNTATKASTRSEKKNNSGKDSLGRSCGSLRRLARAGARFAGGTAAAIGGGFDRFREELTDENVIRLDSSNGLFRGTTEGVLNALDEAPRVARRAYNALLDEEEDG